MANREAADREQEEIYQRYCVKRFRIKDKHKVKAYYKLICRDEKRVRFNIQKINDDYQKFKEKGWEDERIKQYMLDHYDWLERHTCLPEYPCSKCIYGMKLGGCYNWITDINIEHTVDWINKETNDMYKDFTKPSFILEKEKNKNK